jgi:hypothetical protein
VCGAIWARHAWRDISLRDRIATEKELALLAADATIGDRPLTIVGFEFLKNFYRRGSFVERGEQG